MRDGSCRWTTKVDDNNKSYFKLLSESPKPFFQQRVQYAEKVTDIKPSTNEERLILEAYKFFDRKLSKKSLNDKLLEYNKNIKMNYIEQLQLMRDQLFICKIIYVTVQSYDDAYTIFHVLNAKGKNLEPIDIIKNSLYSMLDDGTEISSVDVNWDKIKANTNSIQGKDVFNTFYRHFWLSKYSNIGAKQLVADFNKKIEKSQEKYKEFLEDLLKASDDYKKISQVNKSDWNKPEDTKIYRGLIALENFGITQSRIFILSLIEAKRNKMIKHSLFINTVEFIEYFHFVYNAICTKSTSGLERVYSLFARKLRVCTTNKEAQDCINNLNDTLLNWLPKYEEFEKKFIKIKYSENEQKQKKQVQYILEKIECYKNRYSEVNFDTMSIEHITNQSTKANGFASIGNLLPIGVDLNGRINNKDVKSKISFYKNSGYSTTKSFSDEYVNVYKNMWDEVCIHERSKEMSRIMYNRGKDSSSHVY